MTVQFTGFIHATLPADVEADEKTNTPSSTKIEERKAAIEERKKWLMQNSEELGDEKFLVLTKLIHYAEKQLTDMKSTGTNAKRLDTFNAIFSEATINQNTRAFLQTVINEKMKITGLNSSLIVTLAAAETQLDALLNPSRRLYDSLTFMTLYYTSSNITFLPFVALGLVYYVGREKMVEHTFNAINPCVQKAAPYFHKVKNPVTKLFQNCTNRLSKKESNDTANASGRESTLKMKAQ